MGRKAALMILYGSKHPVSGASARRPILVYKAATSEGELRRIFLPETVWKLLCAGQPPHHKPRHRRVDERLPGGAQPLVISGHPPVVRDPSEGALHHPTPRQHPETPRRHEPLPVHRLSLLGPLHGPNLCYLLGDWLGRL